MIYCADILEFDILYQIEVRDIDENSIYSAVTDSEVESSGDESNSSTPLEEEYFSPCDLQLNMVIVKDEEGTSNPYCKFEDQTLKWKTTKWTLKHWKFRDDPPPSEIAMEFYAMLSQEIHICEECGYSTTTGGKEEDILFINEKYSLHFHKTYFLAALQDNRDNMP